MHIADGILPGQLCAAGYAMSGGVTWYALKAIKRQPNYQSILPKAAMLTAAFFVGSSISLPIPPISLHLVLNGLLGTVLGWFAWPAILVGLFLQGLLLGHGGLTTLGINALLIGIPALIAFGIYELRHKAPPVLSSKGKLLVFSGLAGMVGIGLSASIFYSLILHTIPADFDVALEQRAVLVLILAHIPLMLMEGLFTIMVTQFLHRINPELVEG